jgi:phage tail P2-like protein
MAFLPEQPVWVEDISLLPAPLAADPSLQAIEALAARLSDLDVSAVLTNLVDHVDASALPHLAWQFSLFDEPAWSLAESDDQRRALIKGSIELHRRKGTPWAVRQMIRLLGFGAVEITEGVGHWYLDGTVVLDGLHTLGSEADWSKYIVRLFQPITNNQATLLRSALADVAPARCILHALDFHAAAFRLDGTVHLDGSFNLGIA